MPATAVLPAIRSANDRMVLHGVCWQTYQMLRRDLADSHVRLTYNAGDLEIMSPSRWHEVAGRVLGTLIRTLCLELDIEIGTGGSTTFQREGVERGLEPDECFWIAHEAVVRGKREIDLSVDPPPDLAIEIDISPSAVDRPRIYAALGVPEVWRFTGDELCVEVLGSDGTYHSSETSASFPFLPIADLARFMTIAEQQGETQAVRSFVDWLREQKFER